MSGTNLMIVATVLHEEAMLPIAGPLTELMLEPPAGPVAVRAHCADGRVTLVEFDNCRASQRRSTYPSTCPATGRYRSASPGAGLAVAVADARDLGVELVPEQLR
jgi:proline racemase